MSDDSTPRQAPSTAVFALLTGAFVWGVIWYPYRVLDAAGIGGVAASLLSYAVALAIGLVLLRGRLGGARVSWLLVAIALSAGACNLGYVLATIHGVVMRVLLLFYLAPLWTVLLARLLLDERLNVQGALIIGVSLAGAAAMLWHPELGAPWPAHVAEWIGLGAGFLFALSNVLIRRAEHITIEVKSLSVCVGVIVIAAAILAAGLEPLPRAIDGEGLLLIAVLGVVLLVINLVVQHGLMRTPATRAIVILLSELVFAAASSWLLADETMGLREWIGGGLIVAASLLAARRPK